MHSVLSILSEKTGSYRGFGKNDENESFVSELQLTNKFNTKGFMLDYKVIGKDGTLFHQEYSVISLKSNESPSLWVLSSNHSGMTIHDFSPSTPLTTGAAQTLSFQHGELKNTQSFREIITLDFWPNGDLSYSYAYAMPGEEFKFRSSARMIPGKNWEIPEAKLKSTDNGLVPEGDGWYIVNAKKMRWFKNECFGDFCGFEGNVRFQEYGINIHVIHPNQPNCHYHGENNQEDFLVLKGQCKILIEGQERLLKEWDFVHCPKWTKHVFVGAGTEPCVVLMAGARYGEEVFYPVTALAKKYNACPELETHSPKESYAKVPKSTETKAALI